MGLLLAIDFDGTIADANPPPLHWRPRAREGLIALRNAGHQLVLFSARLTPRYELTPTPAASIEASEFWRTGQLPSGVTEQWERCVEMREFLLRERAWDLFDAVWQNPGKPPCDRFIDDKFEEPNWLGLHELLGVPLLS